LDLAEDLHVHSTYSDGADPVEANVRAAERCGLRRLGCVDHVRADTSWVAEYVRTVRSAAAGSNVVLSAGLEAKIMNASGELDLPPDHAAADLLYAADHQFPWTDGPRAPREVRAAIAAGALSADEALDRLVSATIATMRRYGGQHLVVAHLFSILPKIGLSEEMVTSPALAALAQVACETGATVEVSERWRCPSARVVHALRDAGVPLVSSTDSHQAASIGQYSYVAQLAGALHAPV
jgi:putative hydrolase